MLHFFHQLQSNLVSLMIWGLVINCGLLELFGCCLQSHGTTLWLNQNTGWKRLKRAVEQQSVMTRFVMLHVVMSPTIHTFPSTHFIPERCHGGLLEHIGYVLGQVHILCGPSPAHILYLYICTWDVEVSNVFLMEPFGGFYDVFILVFWSQHRHNGALVPLGMPQMFCYKCIFRYRILWCVYTNLEALHAFLATTRRFYGELFLELSSNWSDTALECVHTCV